MELQKKIQKKRKDGNKKIQAVLLPVLCLFLFFSCDKKKEEYFPSDYVCIIVNQGNFSEQNGSLSLLKADGSIEQEVYTKANSAWKPASIIESAKLYRNMVLLFCSNEDKIEIIDSKTFKILCEPVRGIGIPRYCAIYDGEAYVTCTNSWDPDANGQVCKVNLDTKTVTNKIDINGIPEGIIEINGLLYVAAGNGITVINPKNDKVIRQTELSEKGLEAKHIISDYEGKLWVSFTSDKKTGIASFNVQTNEFVSFIPLEKMDYAGNIDITPDGKNLLYLYASETVGARNPETETAIYSFDIVSETLKTTPVVRGAGFYGFNVNPVNGDIYTANVNGFVTNSIMYIYNAVGEKLNDGLITGVGTCRFVFP